MTHNNGLQNPLQRCADCRAPYPQMYNCDNDGNLKAGFICVDCWKAKHPVMQPTRARMLHPITVRLIIALAFYNIICIYFIIWEGLNK